MNNLEYEYLLDYKCSFIDSQYLNIVFELMQGGSLARILDVKYKEGIKDVTLLASILKPVLQAIIYLHNNSQIHRDIKGSNV